MDSFDRSLAVPAILASVWLFSTGVASEAVADAGGASACLLRHQYEPCGALTEALVRRALPDLDAIELEQQVYSRKPREPKEGRRRAVRMNISSCSYTWPTDMKRAIALPGGKTMEVPRDAALRLTGIIEYPDSARTEFDRTHRTPTEEELKRMDAAFDRKLAEAQAEGKLNDAGRKMGKDIAKQATQGIAYSDVNDIGDAARWESHSSQLSVLVGSVKFDVHASIGEDQALNLKSATAIAKELLQRCE